MAKINILGKEVYNRISAGEVVERPSSIVKEMFENSVDAGAKNITINIENGGINSISIQDDGCGILKDDIEKVFFPHATSKIKVASDLENIATLGFRGEAMSSIAAVSKIELISKTIDDELCHRICIEGGEVKSIDETTGETGTKITVTGIFYNTPARLKFLKTPKSEESEVTNLLEKLILSNPKVAIKYYANDKLIFQSFGDGLEGAMIAVYSKDCVLNCKMISTEKNGIKIEGYLGNINYVKGTKAYQTLIVNGRYVVDSTISSAIHNAYSTYLMKRQYPFYVISLTIPIEFVDVNVHPRKSEVRFQNNQVVYGSVYSVVSKVVDGSSQAIEIIKSSNEIFDSKDSLKVQNSNVSYSEFDEKTPINTQSFSDYSNSSSADSLFEKKTLDSNGRIVYKPYDKTIYSQPITSVRDHSVHIDTNYSDIDIKGDKIADDIFAENKKYIEQQEKETSEAMKQSEINVEKELQLIGQVFNTYLIFECGDDVYMVDQHAAHERILYDKLIENVKNRKITRQQLLIPYCLTFNAIEMDFMYEILDYIREIGFDIEKYGDNSFKVFTVPLEFEDIDVEKFFYDIISDAKFKEEKIPTLIREKLMQKACKSAIKGGDKMSLAEIDCLMSQLKSNFALKCPHGRPVAVKITRTEIEKWFKRIV